MTSHQKMQLLDIEPHLYSSSDDDLMMKKVLATHEPDGRDVDVRPILNVVEKILQRATPAVVEGQQTYLDVVDDKAYHAELLGMLDVFAYTIHRIACEISCKCSRRADAHATTMSLFRTLRSYSWDAKVVLTLAAFAASFGEFWLIAQLFTVNPLEKSVDLLKQFPDILERIDSLKPRFDSLIKPMLDVTECIINLKELPTEYITTASPALKMAIVHLPTAVYCTIRSVVACSSQINGLIGEDHEYVTSTIEARELLTLAHKVNYIQKDLSVQLALCYQYIDEKKSIEDYQTMIRLFVTTHIDNMKILRTLIHSNDDMPLLDCVTRLRVSVEVLRRKTVILLISDLDLSYEVLLVLTKIYNDAQHGKIERPYEIVWLPVIDKTVLWTDSKQNLFLNLASSMPWYSLCHPSLLKPVVIKYIEEVWHFKMNSLLVVLDAQGRVVCPNALHMMWIWGNLAFPFTSLREEALWKEETWSIEFLMGDLDPTILQWVREGRFICLYGGEDILWIKQFTTAMSHVAHEAGIFLEMMYVGKSNPKDRVRKIITTITNEKLSGTWHDLVMIWFFWARIESMWYSKTQQGRTIENDDIMQEVMTMLSYDGSDEEWALVSKGSTEIVTSRGKKIVDSLMNFDTWKETVEHKGFIEALKSALERRK